LEEGKNFYQIQKISKIHPFVIKKNFLLAKNFSINELKKIYKKILEIDFLIKTGKVDPQTGIEIFLMKI
jgi:DNA polymerase III delta subunit